MRQKFYFDALKDGQIPIYDYEKYAWLDEDGLWNICNIETKAFKCLGNPIMRRRAFVPVHEFEGKEGTKFQKWIRNHVSEISIGGTFVIPYRRMSWKEREFRNLVLAGMVFFPEETLWDKWHFMGNAKDASSLAFLATRYMKKDTKNQTDYATFRHAMLQSKYATLRDVKTHANSGPL